MHNPIIWRKNVKLVKINYWNELNNKYIKWLNKLIKIRIILIKLRN